MVIVISLERKTWLAEEKVHVDWNYIINIVTSDAFGQTAKDVTTEGVEGTELALSFFFFPFILSFQMELWSCYHIPGPRSPSFTPITCTYQLQWCVFYLSTRHETEKTKYLFYFSLHRWLADKEELWWSLIKSYWPWNCSLVLILLRTMIPCQNPIECKNQRIRARNLLSCLTCPEH